MLYIMILTPYPHSGVVYSAMKSSQVSTSAVVNNTQVFNLTLANQQEDEDFTFSLKTPMTSFNKTLKVDVRWVKLNWKSSGDVNHSGLWFSILKYFISSPHLL